MPTAAIVASVAATVSALAALVSWWHNREVSRAAIALTDVKIAGNREASTRLRIECLFLLKNVGRESLKISNLRLGHYSFKTKHFEQVGKRPIMNQVHGETIFNYSNGFSVAVDSQLADDALGQALPRIVGKHAIILALDYKGQSRFSIRSRTDRYYLGYAGQAAVYQLTQDEYDEMKDELPMEFLKR